MVMRTNLRRAFTLMELILALGVVGSLMIPLAFSFANEARLCRAYFYEAVAMGILDGEMEILAAGEWKQYPEGSHDYPVKTPAAANLPPGKFVVSIGPRELELKWVPSKKGSGGIIRRKVSRDLI
jgi:prepilin-type N-terminal cleavage/methylation domain-containing protein